MVIEGRWNERGKLLHQKFTGIFPRFRLRKGGIGRAVPVQRILVLVERGEDGVMGKRVLGLMAAAMVFLILAGPLAAAEETLLLDIPGCGS